MQALVQNPRDIVPVNNPKNESLFWREILGHDGDSGSYIATPYAKRLAKQL